MTFTVGQIVAFIIGFLGAILTILNIIDKVTTLKTKSDEPFTELVVKVDELADKLKVLEVALLNNNKRLDKQDETNEVLQTCVLVLVDYELGYCIRTGYDDTEDLMKAKSKLRDHLAKNK